MKIFAPQIDNFIETARIRLLRMRPHEKQMQNHEKPNGMVYAYVPVRVTVSTRILQMIWLQ